MNIEKNNSIHQAHCDIPVCMTGKKHSGTQNHLVFLSTEQEKKRKEKTFQRKHDIQF